MHGMEDAVDHTNEDTSEKLVSDAAAAGETASAVTLQDEADDSRSSEELLHTSTSFEASLGAGSGVFSREKLVVAGGSESASAQTLGEAHVSSLEELISTASLQKSITSSPRTTPCNNNLNGSSTTSPFRHEETVTGVAESARTQALRQLKLDQFVEELLGYSSSEDPTTPSPRAMQHNAIDNGGNRRTGARVADQSIDELLGYSSSEDPNTTTSPRATQHNTIHGSVNRPTAPRNTAFSNLPTASSIGSKILSRRIPDWFEWYYIRMDCQGFFRMYPDLGGPFQSLQEAEDAINRRYDELWRQAWRNAQERAPDRGPSSSTINKNKDDDYRYLVEALLDQYNEDNNLLGNLAHELDEDVVMEEWIYEDHTWYYHYNFTTKKKEARDISLGACTFFAEVAYKHVEDALEVNCCCKIEDEDNGWCYGCRNNGSHGIKHPKNPDAYAGGHLDVFLPFDLEEPSSSDDDV